MSVDQITILLFTETAPKKYTRILLLELAATLEKPEI